MLDTTTRRADDARALDLRAIHEVHADFVWRTLQRHGVRDVDLEDALQEVFVVVHQRLHTFDGSSKLTTWLYGICQRVAIGVRRKAHLRRELVTDDVPDGPSDNDPEAEVEAREARARLHAILDDMPPEKRAIFVMYEVDGVGCEEIAELTDVPIGTVYSRLHAARHAFQLALQRHAARDGSRGRR